MFCVKLGERLQKIVTIIHDTPGINYSGNVKHKKITLKHLVDSKPDIIICLLDATQMLTTDFSDALNDLKKTNKKGSNARILFAINKADSYDPEKESLKRIIQDTGEELVKHGFDNPVIVPVSSRAARLFKMALHEWAYFTQKEIRDFTYYFDFFSCPENDFNLLTAGISDDLKKNTEYITKGKPEIVIEEKTYERLQIIKMLFNTGIPVVENILNVYKEQTK